MGFGDPKKGPFITQAHRIVKQMLRQNVSGVSRDFDDQVGAPIFRSLFRFHNLLDCLYWHLFDAAGGGWIRQCTDPQCGAYFVAKSERVKYCPPPMGK